MTKAFNECCCSKTRAPRDGADIRPRIFFVDNGKSVAYSAQSLASLSLYLFYTLCASCDLLPWEVRSPGQFEWPNLVWSIKGDVAYLSVDPYRRPEHIYGVFIASSWSLSKVIAEKRLTTWNDLKWPKRHNESSLVAIFRLWVSSLPVTRCLGVFRMGLVQKKRRSIFSNWLIGNWEVAKIDLTLGHLYRSSEITIS